ncbi:MAG: LysM peptidoglycan-binding domain-containing protein [Parcubacteria group bacterium]|nr:LysM peptidoglycan-binding domain-containing protein [Parcubacteria group bacterium]
MTPLYYIFLAWILAELRGRVRFVFTWILVILLSSSLLNQYTNPNNPAKEDYRAAAVYASREANPRDIIALSPPYSIYPFQYYYRGEARVTTLPIWDKKKGAIPVLTPERLSNDSEIIQRSHKRLFLLVTTNLEGSVAAKDFFDKHLTKLEKRQFSNNVWLHVYQSEYETPAVAHTEEPRTPTPTTEKPQTRAQSRQYVVERGDTLFGIAETFYGTGYWYPVIERANSLPSPNILEVGQILDIPPNPQSASLVSS